MAEFDERSEKYLVEVFRFLSVLNLIFGLENLSSGKPKLTAVKRSLTVFLRQSRRN